MITQTHKNYTPSGNYGFGKSRLLASIAKKLRSQNAKVVCAVAAQFEEDSKGGHASLTTWRVIIKQLIDRNLTDHNAGNIAEKRHDFLLDICKGHRKESCDYLEKNLPLLNDILAPDIAPFLVDGEMDEVQHDHPVDLDKIQNLLVSLIDLLVGLYRPQHVVLAVDDGSFLDRHSWSLLAELTHRIQPLLIIVCHRPINPLNLPHFSHNIPNGYLSLLNESPNLVLRLRLGCRSPQELMKIACHRIHPELPLRSLPDWLKILLVEKTRGCPYLVLPLIDQLSALHWITGAKASDPVSHVCFRHTKIPPLPCPLQQSHSDKGSMRSSISRASISVASLSHLTDPDDGTATHGDMKKSSEKLTLWEIPFDLPGDMFAYISSIFDRLSLSQAMLMQCCAFVGDFFTFSLVSQIFPLNVDHETLRLGSNSSTQLEEDLDTLLYLKLIRPLTGPKVKQLSGLDRHWERWQWDCTFWEHYPSWKEKCLKSEEKVPTRPLEMRYTFADEYFRKFLLRRMTRKQGRRLQHFMRKLVDKEPILELPLKKDRNSVAKSGSLVFMQACYPSHLGTHPPESKVLQWLPLFFSLGESRDVLTIWSSFDAFCDATKAKNTNASKKSTKSKSSDPVSRQGIIGFIYLKYAICSKSMSLADALDRARKPPALDRDCEEGRRGPDTHARKFHKRASPYASTLTSRVGQSVLSGGSTRFSSDDDEDFYSTKDEQLQELDDISIAALGVLQKSQGQTNSKQSKFELGQLSISSTTTTEAKLEPSQTQPKPLFLFSLRAKHWMRDGNYHKHPQTFFFSCGSKALADEWTACLSESIIYTSGIISQLKLQRVLNDIEQRPVRYSLQQREEYTAALIKKHCDNAVEPVRILHSYIRVRKNHEGKNKVMRSLALSMRGDWKNRFVTLSKDALVFRPKGSRDGIHQVRML